MTQEAVSSRVRVALRLLVSRAMAVLAASCVLRLAARRWQSWMRSKCDKARAEACGRHECEAGALKITEQLLSDYYVTQPYMEKGFQIITKSYPIEPVRACAKRASRAKAFLLIDCLVVARAILGRHVPLTTASVLCLACRV